MIKLFSFFKQIDQLLFSYLDLLQTNSLYQKLVTKLASLNISVQRLIAYSVSFVIVLVPLFATIFFWLHNRNLQNELTVKEEIRDEINKYVSDYNSFTSQSASLLGPSKSVGQENLQNRIKSIAERKKIKADDIQIIDYQVTSQLDSISQVSTSIEVKNFTTENLTDLLQDLIRSDKYKISSLTINRDQEKHLISGQIALINLVKNSINE